MGGKIVLVSIYGKGKVPVDIDSVIINDVDIYGVLASPNTFAGTLALMGAGKINVKPLITHQFPLEEIKKAIQLVYERKEFRIKILLKP
jgi:L-iditol 2-dehydrogenase